MHKRKKYFLVDVVCFVACVYEGGSFTPRNRDTKTSAANSSFMELRETKYFSISWNTCPVFMWYKDKSFMGERSKASNYKLFSLKKKKQQLCPCIVIRVWLCFLLQENRLGPAAAFWMFHQGGDKPLCCLLRRGPWYLNQMSSLEAHMSCRTSSLR